MKPQAMEQDDTANPDGDKLRRQAEAALEGLPGPPDATLSHDEALALVHELQVHQVELELQNEELVRTRREAEVLRDRYADLYDFAPVGYFTLDEAGAIREANLAGAAQLGVDRRSLVGARFAIFIDPDSRPDFAAFLGRILASGATETCEFPFAARAGRGAWHAQLRGLTDTGGVRRSVRLVVTDITDRCRAEEALRESEERFRAVQDNSLDRFTILKPCYNDRDEIVDFIYVYQNARAAKTAGRRPEDLIGRRVTEIWPTFPQTRFFAIYKQVVESGEVTDFEERYRADGVDDWFYVKITPVPDGIAIATQIITERKEAEEALRQSEERYRELFDSMTEVFQVLELVYDENDQAVDFYYREVNPATERLGDISRDEMLGRRARELFGVVEDYWIQALDQVNRSGEPLHLENYSTELDKWYDLNAFKVSDQADTVAIIFSDITERKRAQEALRVSEERYRFALDAGGFGTFDVRFETGEIIRDERLKAIWGLAVDEDLDFAGTFDRVYPDDRELVQETFAAALASDGDGTYEAEYRIILPDGSVRWNSARGQVRFREKDGNRRPVRVVGIEHDVTERRTAEEVLQYQSLILKNISDAIVGVDPQLRVTAWNHAAVQMYGYAADEVMGRTFFELVHPRYIGVTREQVIEQLMTVGSVDLEVLHDTKDGRTLHIESHTMPLRDNQGSIIGFVGVNRDVTESKQAEAALREREQTLQGIFRAAPVGIGMVSHRVITQANDQLCRMTGYDREELVGQDARMLYPSDEAYEFVGREKYAQIAAKGTGAVEAQWRTKDGAVRDILLSSSPTDLSRPFEDVVFSALDITRLRESERAAEQYMDELHRSNEELQRFAYVASHDLQEPLRSIVSFSQLLERRYKGRLGEDADDYIGFIVEGGVRMQRLIEDLLQVSRIETKARPPEPTDAGEIVVDVLRSMETPIREAGATVEVGEMPTVMADAAQLSQVFVNLVSNAIKYRRPDVPAEVRISAEREGLFWRFSVADNGIGIEDEYFDRIFVIFQRLHTRDEYDGTGIGLAVVKRIVERHGGTIRVESTPGEGSIFYFTLPAA